PPCRTTSRPSLPPRRSSDLAHLVVDGHPAEPLPTPADGTAQAELERQQQRLEQPALSRQDQPGAEAHDPDARILGGTSGGLPLTERKSTRLNSSHSQISYAV